MGRQTSFDESSNLFRGLSFFGYGAKWSWGGRRGVRSRKDSKEVSVQRRSDVSTVSLGLAIATSSPGIAEEGSSYNGSRIQSPSRMHFPSRNPSSNQDSSSRVPSSEALTAMSD